MTWCNARRLPLIDMEQQYYEEIIELSPLVDSESGDLADLISPGDWSRKSPMISHESEQETTCGKGFAKGGFAMNQAMVYAGVPGLTLMSTFLLVKER